MPDINLRDGRNRDAIVRALSTGEIADVDYVDATGAPARTCKVLKATSEHSFERLSARVGLGDELAEALVIGDIDVDIERIGMFLVDPVRVFVDSRDEVVYQIEQTEIVRAPNGEERERRPRRRAEPNVDGEFPISWTGRLIPKSVAIRRYVFTRKLQLVHVNGLTYDFLYGMAKELAAADSLMLVGAGRSGKDPLIFQRGATSYRGFLEGRIDGDRYMLILHLSKLELKRPAVTQASQPSQSAVQTASAVATPTPPLDIAAVGRTPTVTEVVSALAATTPSPDGARQEIAGTAAVANALESKAEPPSERPGTAPGATTATSKSRARKPRGKPTAGPAAE